MTKLSNQRVQFRLLQMPCCNTLICWVNPRRPNWCPECGKGVIYHYSRERWTETYSDAWLRIEDDDKAFYSGE